MKMRLYRVVFLLTILATIFPGVNANPVFTSVTPNTSSVSKFGKFELAVVMTAAFTNPYDYSQVSLKCKFTSPAGVVYNTDGFYYQAYTMTQPNVLVPSGSPAWRVRFAPNQPGTWSYLLSCTDVNGTTYYPSGQFQCTQSSLPGFVHTAAGNQFVFDNGMRFLGIGTTLGWSEWAGGFTIYQDWINELADNGANFTKIVMAPWSYEIEWQETGVGNYSARQNRAWALDWIFDRLIEKGIYCQLNVMIHDAIKSGVTPGWQLNPYYNQNGGPCNEPQNFLVNITAKNLFKQKIRYIMARWGYSPGILSWEVLSEADNTGIYDNFRSQTIAWLNEMTEYFIITDPYDRPVSSGFAIPEHDADYWNYTLTGFTQTHIYDLIPDLELKLYDYTREYLQNYNKPTLVGEFALAHSPEEVYQNDPTGTAFHNSLWAIALSGSVATAQSWWWDNYLYPNGLFSHFEPLSNFFGQVNFPSGNPEYDIPFCTSNSNMTQSIYPGFTASMQKAPANNFVVEPSGYLLPNRQNLGKFEYGYFFNSLRNPPHFQVNYTKPGEFTVLTGGSVSLSKIKIWLDGVNIINNTASANASYTINVSVGQHTIFVENTGNGIMEIREYRFFNYAPVLRSFVARNSNHVIGWIQNRKYNWEYLKQSGTPSPVTGGIVNLDNLTKGVYKIDWFGGDGNYDSTVTKLNNSGSLALNTPNISWDGAFEVNYHLPFSIDFAATPTTGDAPLAVQFTNTSYNSGVNIDTWFWDFGDGSTSNQQNPAHTYAYPGTYSVFFKMKSGIYADSILKTNYIVVNQPLVALFTADDVTVTPGTPVQFTDQSLGNPTSWLWMFGDNLISNLKNPAHAYAQPGFYTVTLTVSKAGKSATLVKTNYIEVYIPLVADFTANKTLTVQGESVQFADLSQGNPQNWFWNFGNGQVSAIQNPMVNFEQPGTYSVKLNINNSWRSDSVLKQNYITVVEKLHADFGSDVTFCLAGGDIQFTDLSTGNPESWLWDFGNGTTSSEQNPTVIYTIPGYYSVKLLVNTSFQADSVLKENYIFVPDPLVANFSSNTTFHFTGNNIHFTDLSLGSPQEWLWEFGDGASSIIQNPDHMYSAPGNYSVKLVVSNQWLTDSLTRTNYITIVDSLIANFTADTTFGWLGREIHFTDLSTGNPTSWWWNFGDQTTSRLQNPTHLYTREGTFTVGLAVLNAYQTDTEFKIHYITIREPLHAAFKADTTKVLVQQPVHFTDQSSGFPTFRIWDFGDNTVHTVQNPVHYYQQPGYYTVSLQIFENDSTDMEIKQNYIWVRDSLIADFSVSSQVVNIGESVLFLDNSRGNPTSWKWNFGDNRTSLLKNPANKYKAPGVYTVTLVVSNTLDTDTLIRQSYITVLPPYYSQSVILEDGWSGISTYLQPQNPSLPVIFQEVGNKLYFAQNETGIWWPSQNINTIGNWNPYDGLIVRMTEGDTVTITGALINQAKLDLTSGWNILPVISQCQVDAGPFFQALADTLVIVKEIAGPKVYWPQAGIITLEYLDPGRSYYILLNYNASVIYDQCSGKKGFIHTRKEEIPSNPWCDNISYTPSSHTLAISASAFADPGNSNMTASLAAGDVIGVFAPDGSCSGILAIQHAGPGGRLPAPLALMVVGKDLSHTAPIGFNDGESMRFLLYDNIKGEIYPLSAQFDTSYPDRDIYRTNGLSGICSFKKETQANGLLEANVYPNPGQGIVRVHITGATLPVQLDVSTPDGRNVLKSILDAGSVQQFDLTGYQQGIFLFRFTAGTGTVIKKVVVH